jgi:putative hydrolase of the HAD superfamily
MAATGRYDAVLLDAFGTLVALDRPAARLRDSLRARLGIEVDHERARSAIRAEIAHYAAGCRWAADATSLEKLRRECAGVLERELELEVEAGERMLEVLADAIVLRTFADVPPALRLLGGRGLALAVVSNGDCLLGESLETAGLRFDVVLDSATTGAAKPHPAIFRRALDRLGVAAGRALHVGDDPVNDLEGARAAGIDAVLIDRSGQGPAGSIGALTELEALLA